MTECLKFLPCLLLLLFAACSTHVAGTTEETNALANDEGNLGKDSSETENLQPVVVDTSDVPATDRVMYAAYWSPYWKGTTDEESVRVQIDSEEGGNLTVSYGVESSPFGGSVGAPTATTFGVAIRVAGEGPDVFSEMKTWTGGACYMLTSDVPITLKMGMSPEKEQELEYDLPQATLIGPGEVGNLVLRCLSWLDFEQQGFGPSITIEEAFFDYMTELRFEVQLEDGNNKGSFEIYEIRRGGTGISANVDGTDMTVEDGE